MRPTHPLFLGRIAYNGSMKMRTGVVVAVVVVLLALGLLVALGSQEAGILSGGRLPGAHTTPASAALHPGPTVTPPASRGPAGAPQYGLLGPEGVPGDPYAQAPVPTDNAGDEDR